ncbi:hypothetical protein GW796_05650 [archaeon]|nr:hypothetical protein [archaeon]NCQ51368.1 hypothetical protein [archaeon]NCT58806.1 hypothetical protein [archaeon]
MDFNQVLKKLEEQEIEVEYNIPSGKESIADRVFSPLLKQQSQKNKNKISASPALQKTGPNKGKKIKVRYRNAQEKEAYERKLGIGE